MSPAARSVSLFGAYLLGLGAVLLVVPNFLLGAFGLEPTTEVWIRVVGMLTLFLGVYYQVGARAESRPFLSMTVYVRAAVPLFFGVFVAAGWAPAQLLLFGLVDALGAAWTATALRRES